MANHHEMANLIWQIADLLRGPYPEGFFEVWLPVPPPAEQAAIVRHVAAKTGKLVALRHATRRTIAFRKERRSALITAAVMGEIDVQSNGASG